MAIYVVMEPSTSAVKKASESAVFIRDGFYFFGCIAPVFWMIWHRLWVLAAVTFAVMIILSMVGEWAGIIAAVPLLSLLISFYIGIEGGVLRVAALRRAGWRQWGVIEANTIDDAEMRYIDALNDVAGEHQPSAVAISHTISSRPKPSCAALGLLCYPGRN